MTTNLTPYEHDIFLSYNRTDEEWVAKLAERLEQEEWQGRKLKVFFAPWDIRPGQSIPLEIERALPKSRKVGIVLSPEAMDSAWVELERLVTTHIAVTSREDRLIPLLRRACEVPALLRHILSIDFKDDSRFEESYQKLLAVIKDAPLPRVSSTPSVKPVSTASLIPRPPALGFVVRRDAQGRDIVERLKEVLAPGQDNLVTLSGPGGIGKTTLAIVAARSLLAAYRGRVVWSSADARADFTILALLDDIATQLGRADLRTLAPDAKIEQTLALVADSPTLVVLDNFETVADDERRRIGEWFTRAQSSALLTSRTGVAETIPVIVSAMSRAEATEFLETLIAPMPDAEIFSVEVRQRIYETAEANPFVMKWVTAQIGAAAQEPDTIFKELSEGEGDAAQRVFDRSFNLPQLGDDGRAALRALSLFVPDASREALAAVAGFGDDMKRLNEAIKNLYELWLIKATDQNRRLTVEGLTRSLAGALLSKDERANEARCKFIECLLNYAESHSQPKPENFNALEAEKDNVLNAIEIAFAMNDWERVLKIYAALEEFLDIRGHWNEAIHIGQQAIRAACVVRSPWDVEVMKVNTAIIYMHRGEHKEALQIHKQALDYFEKVQSEINIARIRHNLGILAYDRGNLGEAQCFYISSSVIKERLGDQIGIANTLYQQGMISEDREDLVEAQRCYADSLKIRKESLRKRKELGDQRNLAITLHNLALIAQYQQDFSKVRMYYTESLEINKELGDKLGVAITLHKLGENEEDHGFLEEALRCYKESLNISTELGFQFGLSITLRKLWKLLETLGDSKEAQRYYDESQKISDVIDNQRGTDNTLTEVRLEKASFGNDESFEISRRLGYRRGLATILYSLRLIARNDVYKAEAARLLREALYIYEKPTLR